MNEIEKANQITEITGEFWKWYTDAALNATPPARMSEFNELHPTQISCMCIAMSKVLEKYGKEIK